MPSALQSLSEPKFLKAGDVVQLGIDGPCRADVEDRELQDLSGAAGSVPGSHRIN